ncbi:MAG: 3-deoxy-D-manno-octulosonic acid kinase [Gammaproteobacteria bacterium]|jgi:3-deoxy-D-manno-octulosonic acid kinase
MSENTKNTRCYILHDETAIHKLESEHFNASYWQGMLGFERIDGGRGGSVKILIDGQVAILRQYLRGGLIARFLTDQYLWLGKSKTRPWQEWSILNLAIEAALPVPKPLGIRVIRTGFYYRASLMTDFFEDTETLAESLSHNSLAQEAWFRLGRLLKQFQEKGFRHADLNANNILMNDKGEFFLIDFDQAKMMAALGDWQWKPLYRLQRSLDKINRARPLHYGDDDWQALMDGYQAKG